MSKSDNDVFSETYVSPYLRRPLRTYEQFLREQAERARVAGRTDASNHTATRETAPREAGSGATLRPAAPRQVRSHAADK